MSPKHLFRPLTGCVQQVYLLCTILLLLSAPAFSQLSASFVSDKEGGCAPFTIQFTNTSNGASANAIYKWDFGNGNSSDLQNPAAIFTEEKTYTVKLTVTDEGKTEVYTSQVTGFKKPVANFSVVANKACIPATIQFVSSSTTEAGTIVDYFWDFGDGGVERGYGENMSHTYMTLMKPTVNLTVTNNHGCHSTVEKKEIAEILPSMQASFTASKQVLCKETDAVQFNNTSSGPGTLSYSWSFGDGNSSTTKNPSYSFNKKGIYTVGLTVKNAEGCTVTDTQTDLLNVASYNASFTAPALICKDQQATFNAGSVPRADSYEWYIDDQPYYNWDYESYLTYFADTGKHTVKLINTFGTCKDTATQVVNVKSVIQPTNFLADQQNFCGAPTVVKFKDTTAGAIKWDWKFRDYDPPTSTLQNPSYTYTANGGYFVNLTVTNVHGCSNSMGKYIIITSPYVHIGNKLPYSEDNYNCGYTKVQMYATDFSDSVASYKWNFGDGVTSTEAEPVHEYTKPGNYAVSLEYTLKNGCKGISHHTAFTVYKKPKADFTVSPGTNICGNTPVTYIYNGGSEFTNLAWELEGEHSYYHDGLNTRYRVQYGAEGVYGTKLTVINGNCWDTITKPKYVTVKLPFPKISTYQQTCEGTRGKVSFTQASIGATAIRWEFGDDQTQPFNSSEPNVEHEYTKTGTYKVVLIATNESCNVRDSIYINVLMKQKPVLALNPTEICANTATNYNASGYEVNPAATGWDGYYVKRWEYSDGTEFDGSFTREVINNIYQNWVTNGKGTVVSNQPKDSKIRLITYSSGFTCEDTSTYATIKFKGANAAFDVVKDKVCFNTSDIVFKDASTAPNNSITRWLWNFGDGQTETLTQGGEVKHKYATPGSYNVTLTITDAGGCSSTTAAYSKQVEVFGPQAAFSMSHGNNVPLNTTVTFYNNTNSYGVDNPVYEWDFGDGSPKGRDYSEVHNYPNPGTYTIRLKVTNPATGCTSQTEQTLLVRYFNSAFQYSKSFITVSQCAPAVVSFQNTSYDYTKIIWDFGDGSAPLTDVNYPSHVYKDAGEYVVILSVYGYNGLKGHYKDTINVLKPVGSLKAAPAEVCIGQEVQLKASGPGIAQYTWDMGDGVISISQDSVYKYNYPSAGVYRPQLLIADAYGCTQPAIADDIVKVREKPLLTITPQQSRICLGEQVQFVANATNAVQYVWKPANGITQLNIANPVAKPTNSTTYEVQVKDDIGCTVDGTATIMVVQPEFLKVSADTGICFGEQVQLTATGTSKFAWINNTSGLSNTDIPNPVAKPLTSNTYTVTGGDIYGCFPDTADIKIAVYDLPWVTAPKDEEIIAGTPIHLKPQYSADAIQWRWTPQIYLDCPVCPNPLATVLGTTTYTITVANRNGCTASDDVKIKMQCDEAKVFIPNAFTPGSDGKNDVFNILGISYVKHMVIYNRYGKKVFERRDFLAADKKLGWDGTLNGMQLQTDTYVYFVEMQCETGGVFTRKGTITLIR